MWFFCIVIFIIVFLALCGRAFDKNGNKKSSVQLDVLKKSHDVTLAFATSTGYFAFCDGEEKIYTYCVFTSALEEIKYENVIRCERNVKGVSFWALTSKYADYALGDVEEDHLLVLLDKIGEIIKANTNKAYLEYCQIVAMPKDVAQVTVKGFAGKSVDISSTIKGLRNVYIWADTDNVYLLPRFAFFDFRLRSSIYKLVTVEKANILQLTQEGNTHYVTEVQGGGGGGFSVAGAVVGGMVAGEVGAIIGSRKSTNPTTSSIKQIDDRSTNLKIVDSNNDFSEIIFEHSDYYIISKMIT